MPLLHCNECHHEWECTTKKPKCNWCGGDFYILEKQTSFEKFVKDLLKNPEKYLNIIGEL